MPSFNIPINLPHSHSSRSSGVNLGFADEDRTRIADKFLQNFKAPEKKLGAKELKRIEEEKIRRERAKLDPLGLHAKLLKQKKEKKKFSADVDRHYQNLLRKDQEQRYGVDIFTSYVRQSQEKLLSSKRLESISKEKDLQHQLANIKSESRKLNLDIKNSFRANSHDGMNGNRVAYDLRIHHCKYAREKSAGQNLQSMSLSNFNPRSGGLGGNQMSTSHMSGFGLNNNHGGSSSSSSRGPSRSSFSIATNGLNIGSAQSAIRGTRNPGNQANSNNHYFVNPSFNNNFSLYGNFPASQAPGPYNNGSGPGPKNKINLSHSQSQIIQMMSSDSADNSVSESGPSSATDSNWSMPANMKVGQHNGGGHIGGGHISNIGSSANNSYSIGVNSAREDEEDSDEEDGDLAAVHQFLDFLIESNTTLQKVFKSVDTNNSGSASRFEFTDGLLRMHFLGGTKSSKSCIDAIFRVLDADKNSNMEWEEFKKLQPYLDRRKDKMERYRNRLFGDLHSKSLEW